MRKGEPSKEAVSRRLKSSLEELLTRPLKETDTRRYARSMPGMSSWLVTQWMRDSYKNDLKIGQLDKRLASKDKSNPVRRT